MQVSKPSQQLPSSQTSAPCGFRHLSYSPSYQTWLQNTHGRQFQGPAPVVVPPNNQYVEIMNFNSFTDIVQVFTICQQSPLQCRPESTGSPAYQSPGLSHATTSSGGCRLPVLLNNVIDLTVDEADGMLQCFSFIPGS